LKTLAIIELYRTEYRLTKHGNGVKLSLYWSVIVKNRVAQF